jgi:5'-nucleotidase
MGGVLGKTPDLVVSGINLGHNLGIDVTYSGTVACAMEAVIKGLPGIAVSAGFAADAGEHLPAIYRALAAQVAELIPQVLARGLPPHTLLNINAPNTPPQSWGGLHVTRMGQREYPMGELIERQDPWGRPYYWLGGEPPVDLLDDGSDVGAVANGFVSVTPISLDMTHRAFLEDLRRWDWALAGVAE